jgi:hypothetical protein
MVPITSGCPAWPTSRMWRPRLMVDLGLAMHLGHQRAGRVDGEEAALTGLGGHRFRHAMGGEDHRPESRRAPRRVPRRRPRPSASAIRPRICCARSRGGHRPARHAGSAPSRPRRWRARRLRRSRAAHRAGCRAAAWSRRKGPLENAPPSFGVGRAMSRKLDCARCRAGHRQMHRLASHGDAWRPPGERPCGRSAAV